MPCNLSRSNGLGPLTGMVIHPTLLSVETAGSVPVDAVVVPVLVAAVVDAVVAGFVVAAAVAVEPVVMAGAAASGGGMERFWRAGPEELVLGIAILAILVAIAYYVIKKIRPKPVQKEPKASQWLSKFRELHSQGKLSDEEFRTIKTALAAQLQEELRDNDEEG